MGFLVLAGLILGSFLSVVINRLANGQSGIILGRSNCPRCGVGLAGRDLIPILSFFINRRRCRFCQQAISWGYPLLELTSAVIILINGWLWGWSGELIFWSIVWLVLLAITIIDWRKQIIPDVLIWPLIVLALAWRLIAGGSGGELLLSMIVGGGFFALQYLISGGRWLGLGDVKLGLLIGLLTGWPTVVVAIFAGYVVGAVAQIPGLLSKKLSWGTAVPFGPYLIAGLLIALIWAENIIAWYLSLL